MRRWNLAIWALVLAALLTGRVGAQAVGGLQPDSGRDCAACHLEWAESFKQPGARLLVNRPDKPVVAESEMCLSCHDGSVADSRREVWLEHSHKTGLAPSTGMTVPQQLPLEDGKLACRTCHTAHAAGVSGTLKDAVFLRMKNDEGQLCKACHAEQAQGPELGNHPLTKLPWKLPDSLAQAGAHAGTGNEQVVCQSCHLAHGSKKDHMLVLGTESSQLCLTCHEKMRPAMWDSSHEHPQNPPIRSDAHRRAIAQMGTKIGADGTLICLSCHKMHKGKSGKAMLAETMDDSKLCIRCHEDRAALVGSGHDLRKSAPNELNRLGKTAQQSGPCGACHSFHAYAREPAPAEGDPQGLCRTCHAEGKVAAKHTGLPFSHPSDIEDGHLPKDAKLALYPSAKDSKRKAVACLSCHNPHEVAQPHFLRMTNDQLCANCHAGKVETMAGPHDFTKKPMQNARGRSVEQTGKCGFCHSVHNANGPVMWVATKNAPQGTNELCTECHRAEGLAGKKPAAMFNHPTGPSARPTTRPANLALPLYNAQGHQTDSGSVACGSCHDVHTSGKRAKHLLRSADATSLCTQCHPSQAQMAGSMHDVRSSTKPWPGKSKGDLCTGCHDPHNNDPAQGTWTVAVDQHYKGGDAACVACHANHGWTQGNGNFKIGEVVHPQLVKPDSEARNLPHGFPLKQGPNSPAPDTLMCKTCHNPHSPPEALHLLRIKKDESPFNVCLQCHAEPRYVVKSMHSPDLIGTDEKHLSHGCLPCHATHAVKGSSRTLLWAAKTNLQGRTPSERLCLGCHSQAGGAKDPLVMRHPETALKKLTDVIKNPSELQKKLSAIDQITCSTCHLPHGKEPPIDPNAPVQSRRVRLSQSKPMLRANVDREICSTCHGIDSARVYLYFHNPKKRAEVLKYIGQ